MCQWNLNIFLTFRDIKIDFCAINLKSSFATLNSFLQHGKIYAIKSLLSFSSTDSSRIFFHYFSGLSNTNLTHLESDLPRVVFVSSLPYP